MHDSADAALKGSVRLGGYLRRLRAGYGYSLRRVEERARAEGGEIDNSQLSRYEKGICYPSFDKLRVLANVFNVSVQAFSDVVDLEEFEALRPSSEDPDEVLASALEWLRAGDYGRAFAAYEKAVDLLHAKPEDPSRNATLGQARVSLAHVLSRLGKLALAEHELKQALRMVDSLGPTVSARALLALANLHADQGNHFLAEIEAERAHVVATKTNERGVAAMAVHTMGHVLSERRLPAEAIEKFREAEAIYVETGNAFEAVRVRINIGVCFVALGKTREGIRLLRNAMGEAHTSGSRRLEAQAWSNLGEAHYLLPDHTQAQACFRQSDALAGGGSERYPDLLFFNSYYEWKMAAEQGNPTREKIAFGRLKVLRSSLEKRFPEVEIFDAYVERGRNHE